MKILVTGGTGFVGRHIVNELVRRGTDVTSTSSRDRPLEQNVEHVCMDITDRNSTSSIDADVVIHCAAYIGTDAQQAHAVNAHGAENVLSAAKTCGARVISIGTLSVYGSGPHAGLDIADLAPAPESPASSARVVGESRILEAGGTVLRAGLTYGVEDKWLIPALRGMGETLGFTTSMLRSLSSVVSSSALARVAVSFAVDGTGAHGWPYAVAHPSPVNLVELTRCLTKFHASERSEEGLQKAREKLGLSIHQMNLVLQDHWYLATEAWSEAHVDPGPRIDLNSEILDWYAQRI